MESEYLLVPTWAQGACPGKLPTPQAQTPERWGGEAAESRGWHREAQVPWSMGTLAGAQLPVVKKSEKNKTEGRYGRH